NPDRASAVRAAVQELIWPVTTSTITTVVVFLPLGLLTGVEGQFFKSLSVTLTVAVLVSLVLALSIIPLLSAQFIRPVDVDEGVAGTAPREVSARIGAVIDAMSDWYERSLAGALHHTRLMIAAA